MRTLSFAPTVAFGAALFAVVPSLAQTGAPLSAPKPDVVTLTVTDDETYGPYITDSRGHSVYIFTKDDKGVSRCEAQCLEGWPPVLTRDKPRAGDKIDGSKIGAIDRKGNERQVTFDGRPLYYYKLDGGTKATSGQAVFSYDGDWFLISPKGEPIKDKRKGRTEPPR